MRSQKFDVYSPPPPQEVSRKNCPLNPFSRARKIMTSKHPLFGKLVGKTHPGREIQNFCFKFGSRSMQRLRRYASGKKDGQDSKSERTKT